MQELTRRHRRPRPLRRMRRWWRATPTNEAIPALLGVAVLLAAALALVLFEVSRH